MMKITGIILAMLLSLPPAYVDQDEVNREERMQVIAEAIAHASSRATCSDIYAEPGCSRIWNGDSEDLAAMLVTKGWWESRFVSNVHAGKCKDYECDAVKTKHGIIHRARSPWQIQRTAYSESLWTEMVGDDFESTRNAAWVAAKILSEGKRRCKSNFGAISWYANGRCNWSKTQNRFLTFEKLTNRR